MTNVLTTLAEAIDEAARQLGTDMMDDTWQSLGCSEVEALAEVFRLTGHGDAARMIVAQHSWGDEPEDLHYPFLGAIVETVYEEGGLPHRRGRVYASPNNDDDRVMVGWDDGAVGPAMRVDLAIVKGGHHDYQYSVQYSR